MRHKQATSLYLHRTASATHALQMLLPLIELLYPQNKCQCDKIQAKLSEKSIVYSLIELASEEFVSLGLHMS